MGIFIIKLLVNANVLVNLLPGNKRVRYMVQNLLEKLLLKDEKNLLIQGLPSSIEKQFSKLSFAKNLTPLLKSRRIDFALIFAVNEKQLNDILREVIPAMHPDGKLWVAYPKTTSKIATDLNRDSSWQHLADKGFSAVRQIALDHVWTAAWFKIQPAAEKKNSPIRLALEQV